MARHFHRIKIKDITRETADTVAITFDIPAESKADFSYKQGQYVTIRIPQLGGDNRRAYSLCSSPVCDDDLQVAVKKVDEGLISQYINHTLKVGDEVDAMPPLGNFTIDCVPSQKRDYIFIGGGSGITPLLSIIKTLLICEPLSTLHLIYANRNEESIIFRSKLDELQKKYTSRLSVKHILSRPSGTWQGAIGRINKDFLKEHIAESSNINREKAIFFVCGPSGLMQETAFALEELNVPKENIKKESFTVELPKEEVKTNINEEILTKKVKIILYNQENEMTVEPDETILTAAIREGYDPPFSCQIGACSTCRAKLISGTVIMDEHDALTDSEIEEGYVLTCQAHPTSDNVLVNFDEY